jgi:hypothetical protein
MESNEERYARLASQVERPEAWKPEPGDTLVGEVVRWELAEPSGLNDLTRPCDVCVVRDEDGKEHAVWTWHYKLRLTLVGDGEAEPGGDPEAFAAKPGTWVAIKFLGKREKVDRPGETVAAYNVALEDKDDSDESEFGF